MKKNTEFDPIYCNLFVNMLVNCIMKYEKNCWLKPSIKSWKDLVKDEQIDYLFYIKQYVK